MFKYTALQWAFNFFTSVKLSTDGKSITCDLPEHIYDLQSAMTTLKFMLQDDGISRIPPGCKLPHQHYRNPAIFEDSERSVKLYAVIDKFDHGDQYVELYVRDDNRYGFMVGYESLVKGKEPNPLTRHSTEKCLAELNEDTRMFKSAVKYLSERLGKEFSMDDVKVKYAEQLQREQQFLAELNLG